MEEQQQKEPRIQKINELLEQGKSKGILTYKEIMDALEELELDQEQVEKLLRYINESPFGIVQKLEL